MADISTLARPYAKAVFELARDSGQFKDWSGTLATIAQAVASPEVAPWINHPALSNEDLVAALTQALGGSLSPAGLGLLRLLSENGRLSIAPEIARQYEALRAAAEARADVEITTAVAVPAGQQEQLLQAVGKRLARQVSVEWKTDESLIAGAVIRAGDLVIDGSVKTELERLQTALSK